VSGHQARGERQGLAKLTDDLVAEIRHRYATGLPTQAVLAREFGVTQATISLILKNRTWTHVPAASATATSTTTLATPQPVTTEGFGSRVGDLADGDSSPAVCVPNSMASNDFPTEPQAKADEWRQFLAPLAQDEPKPECPYQVAV
jgi:hypothetical protein